MGRIAFIILLFSVKLSAQIGLPNTLYTDGNSYPIVFSNEIKGGYQQVLTIGQRDSITVLRRQEGMLVYVASVDSFYQLIGGTLNTDWQPLALKQLTESEVDAFVSNNGYLTSFTEVDASIFNELDTIYIGLNGSFLGLSNNDSINIVVPLFDTLLVRSIVNDSLDEIRNIGYLTTETDPIFSAWNRSDGISITESQISDLSHTVNTDSQKIDTFTIVSNVLRLSLEGDGQAFKTVSLTPYVKLTQEEVQDFAGALFGGTETGITVTYNDAGNNITFTTVDQSATNEIQKIDTFAIVGNILRASLENDNEAFKSVDLSQFEESQSIIDTAAAIRGSGYLTVEVDGSTTNEIQYLGINGDSLTLTNGGSVDLSVYEESQALVDSISAIRNTGYITSQTDNQVLSISNDTLFLEDGGQVLLTDFLDNTDDQQIDFDTLTNIVTLEDGGDPFNLSRFLDNTDEQQLTLDGDTLSLQYGGAPILLSKYYDNTDDQTISIVDDTLFIEDGGSVYLGGYLDDRDTQQLSLVLDSLFLTNSVGVDLSQYDNSQQIIDSSQSLRTSIEGIVVTASTQDLAIADSVLTISGGDGITMTKGADNEQVFRDVGNNTKTYVFLNDIPVLDEQQLSLNGTELSIEAGNTIDLKNMDLVGGVDTIYVDGTDLKFTIDGVEYIIALEDCSIYDDQVLTLNPTTNILSIENGNSVDLSPYVSPQNAIQPQFALNIGGDDLVFVNDSLYIYGGGDGVSLKKYNFKWELLDSIEILNERITAGDHWTRDENGELYYSGGKVGIGTPDPVAILHVETGGEDDILFDNGGADIIDIKFREQNTARSGIRYDGTLTGDKNKLEVYNYFDGYPIAQFENSGEFWLPAYSQDTIATEAVSLLGIASNGKVVNMDLSADGEWLKNGADTIYYDLGNVEIRDGDLLIQDETPTIKFQDLDTFSGSTFSWTMTGDASGLILGSYKNTPPTELSTEVIKIDRSSLNAIPDWISLKFKTGIGTNLPYNMLDVEGGAVIGETYSGNNTAPTNGLLVEGNVGIGTTNPIEKLHVNGNISLSATGGSYSYLGNESNTGAFSILNGGRYASNSKSYAAFGETFLTFSAPYIEFSTNKSVGDFGTNAMRIASDGNVGIGTLSPNSQLSLGNSNNINIDFQLTGLHATQSSARIYNAYDAVSWGQNRLTFAVNNGTGVPIDVMSIKNGNVGIGTTSPSQKLDVVGQIQTTSHVNAGIGTGSVAMTLNDGYGNANLTFNHLRGKADVTGNAGRIEVNVDATTNSAMSFELKDNLTAGVATSLNEVMILYGDGKVKMSDYGVGSNVGTATYSLAVDASGNVIEEPLSGSNTWYNVTYGTNTGNGGYANLQCMCNADGQVFFKGTHATTATVSSGATIMTLPTECRPNRQFAHRENITNISNGLNVTDYVIIIRTNGVITCNNSLLTNYSLNMHTLTYNKNL